MYELRVMNGYHRGASLPLLDEALTIGAADEADVVLADPGIESRHAEVALTPSGWTLRALDGVVRDADSNRGATVLTLAPGAFARIDHVWLSVVGQGSAWLEPPREPADEAEEPVASGEPQTGPVQDAAPASIEAMDASHVSPAVADAPGFLSRKRTLVLAPLALAGVLSAAAAYAMTRSYPPLSAADGGNDMLAQALPASPARVEMERMARENKMAAPERMLKLPKAKGHGDEIPQHPMKMQDPGVFKAVSSASAPKLSQEQLRHAFRQRLAEVDLLKRFNLQLEDRSWSMQAALEEEDAERFQRMLSAFMAKYAIDFPVEVKIGGAEAMLPFKIQQVVSGTNASIVTDDGRRLYVGDEYRGMKLAGIEGNQLSFTGKRSINVTW